MELIFNPCGEFRRAQLAKSTLLISTLVTLGSFKICSDATGIYRTYSILGKTKDLVPNFAVEDLPSAELQSKFLRLQ